MYGENARKGILSNISVRCRDAATTSTVATAATAVQAAAPVTMEVCGKLTVQPVTEAQAFVLSATSTTSSSRRLLLHYQTEASGRCLGAANSPPSMPQLELVACDTSAPGQQWVLNTSQQLLVNELHGCSGGPECVLSEYGNGGYQAGDTVVLYGTDAGQFGANQIVRYHSGDRLPPPPPPPPPCLQHCAREQTWSRKVQSSLHNSLRPSPTGVGSQIVIDVAGLCVTAGAKPPPPPPPPPGTPIIHGFLHQNGTIGEYHRCGRLSWGKQSLRAGGRGGWREWVGAQTPPFC